MKLQYHLLTTAPLLLTLSLSGVRAEEGGTMPAWMRGTWIAVDVHQVEDPDRDYDPVKRYSGKPLVITADEIRFRDSGCEVANIIVKKGSSAAAFHDASSGYQPREYGLPPDHGNVVYYDVDCRHRLIIYEKGESRADPSAHIEKSIPVRWSIIIRSHEEIDIPYYGATYIRFRRMAGPTA